MSYNCLLIAAIVLVIAFETIGLWFLNNKLNIPVERMDAANWIYQISILVFVVGVLQVPYNATIISYEKMSFYAYISIGDAVFKLLVIFLLLLFPFDKLILYSWLHFSVCAVVFFIYRTYCRKHFSISHYKVLWDSSLFRQLFSFTGWSVFNVFSNISIQQATNFVVNVFIGVVGNAAMGLSNSVSSIINHFVTNFQTAFRPSIVKLYSKGDTNQLHLLALRSASFSYYLLLVIAVPVILNIDALLNLWLDQVPDYVAGLCVIFILYNFIDAIQSPLWMIITASGDIRTYSLFSGGIFILNLPLAWLALFYGLSIYWVAIIRVLLNFITAIVRTVYVGSVFSFPTRQYLTQVVLRASFVTIVICGACIIMQKVLFDGHSMAFLQISLYFLISCVSVMMLGVRPFERRMIFEMILSKLKISR